MRDIELRGTANQEDHAHAQEVREYQRRHRLLINNLSQIGSIASLRRIRVVRPTQPPYHFIRGEAIDFVFPAQTNASLAELITVVKLPGLEVQIEEHRKYHFDRDIANGMLRLCYDDSEAVPLMTLNDLRDESVVPQEALMVITATFGNN